MDSIFIRTLCTDKVKVRAGKVSKRFRTAVLNRLVDLFEGKCSHHGYIRKNSIELYKISPGEILVHTLNGDVQYTVQYYAEICNPSVGTSIRARVVNKNKFGILAHVFDARVEDPVLEIIVPQDAIPKTDEPNAMEDVSKGQEITIQVLGRKYAIGDTKISIVGTMTQSHSTHRLQDAKPSAKKEALFEADPEGEDTDAETEEVADTEQLTEADPEEEEEDLDDEEKQNDDEEEEEAEEEVEDDDYEEDEDIEEDDEEEADEEDT